MDQLRRKRWVGVRSDREGGEGGEVVQSMAERRRRASQRADNMDIDRVTGISITEWPRGGGTGGDTISTTTTRALRAGPGREGGEGERGGAGGGGGISAEWSGSHGALATEVELRLHPSPAHPARVALHPTAANSIVTASTTPGDGNNGYNVTTRNDTDRGGGGERSGGGGGSGLVVRAEEALIVTFVLLLWVAAIALFINRWGKIRMLEPYQPKFQQQQHRASCPASIAPDPAQPLPPPAAAVTAAAAAAAHHRLSFSRGCSSCGDYTMMLGGGGGGGGGCRQTCLYLAHRPRQHSVFAGSAGTMALIPESPARRSHSAADLRALLLPRQTSTSRQRYLAVTDV